MARFEFRLPDVGEGIHEAEIVGIAARVGDLLAEHDPMLEVGTDKANVSIGAPRAGRVLEIRASVGQVLKIGAVVVVLEVEGEERAEPAASAVGDLRDELPASHYFDTRPAGDRPLATPATRALARERGVDLHALVGSGPEGRITDADVRGQGGAKTSIANEPGDRREPLVGIRRAIALRMQKAVTTAAHFTFVEECDATRLLALRDSLRAEASREGVELTLLPFVARAVAAALRAHPALNVALDEATNEIVHRAAIHLGIATATERGLLVPVLRDADRRSLLELGREIARLGAAARAGTLAPAELGGSTFTLTSLGKQGGLLATPVLNLPEVGILGVHRIRKRPVVRGDRIEIGDVMLLSLSCDHRLVDGDVAAAFAYDVIARLEEPASLLAPIR